MVPVFLGGWIVEKVAVLERVKRGLKRGAPRAYSRGKRDLAKTVDAVVQLIQEHLARAHFGYFFPQNGQNVATSFLVFSFLLMVSVSTQAYSSPVWKLIIVTTCTF
jgi:hypothetical protein